MLRPLAGLSFIVVSSLGLIAQEAPKPDPAPAPIQLVPDATPAPVPAAIPVAPAQPPTSVKFVTLLDDGLLDPTWFNADIKFLSDGDVDYFWIKPGLNLAGHTLYMKMWEDPAMLNTNREGKDNAKATALTDTLPATIRGALSSAFKGRVKVSRNDGDIEVQGRIVDCNAGSTAKKWIIGFGAGQERVTFDIKLVDSATKELLVAVHHRIISGTMLSTMESKNVKWADKFGQFMAEKSVR